MELNCKVFWLSGKSTLSFISNAGFVFLLFSKGMDDCSSKKKKTQKKHTHIYYAWVFLFFFSYSLPESNLTWEIKSVSLMFKLFLMLGLIHLNSIVRGVFRKNKTFPPFYISFAFISFIFLVVYLSFYPSIHPSDYYYYNFFLKQFRLKSRKLPII